MNATEVIQLLAEKHSNDIFVSECKNGPTTSAARGQMRRMDAWVMARSWRHLALTAYEVKVSRSDFLNDKKWPAYLTCCNHFYFVCPTGLIQPDEVHKDCGLMWVSKTGRKLYTKKKAPSRDIEPPLDVLNYVLICRAKIGAEQYERNNLEYWKTWLEAEEDKWTVGSNVGRKLHDMYKRDVRDVQVNNDNLTARIKQLEKVQKFCDDLGVDVNRWMTEGTIAKRLQEVTTGVPREVEGLIKIARERLQAAERLIDNGKLKGEDDDDEA